MTSFVVVLAGPRGLCCAESASTGSNARARRLWLGGPMNFELSEPGAASASCNPYNLEKKIPPRRLIAMVRSTIRCSPSV